jgi:sigma-B regulation protein RsbU (phosphoserine phosphatase)
MNFARQVQLALFPKHLPSGDGLEFSALCIPARGVSGDYYDILRLSDGRLAFAIADISGKGISAAILMANLQALLRVVTQSANLPSEVCSKLNEHLHAVTDESKFATFFYAEWNSVERCLRYVNAGHNPPMLVSAGGSHLLEEGGIPLGIMPDWKYETGEATLANDDLLVLYSDGITEAGFNNGREFGAARLASLVAKLRSRPLEDIQKSILQSVQTWGGKEPEDDMTLVLVRAREHQATE